MKPSGIEWIGDIPDDWEVRKLLSLFKEHKDRNKNLEEQNLLSLSYGKIKRKDINNNDGLLPASFETYNIVENGDIVFRLTDLQNDKRSLRTGIVTQRGIITSAYVTIRPKIRLDSRFFHYLYHMYDICKVFYGMGDGVRQGMGFEDLKNIPTLIPPLKTQQKIADYLDKKCGEIDATIAKQKESIEKLKAYKQSLISETVTKGLDKSAPLKPSGIKWLGEIPQNARIIRLRFLSSIQTGDKDTANRVENGKYPFYVRSPIVERIDTFSFDGEAILMAGDGVGAGKVFHYVNGKFDYHQRVYNIHNLKGVLGKFLYYYLRENFYKEIEQSNAKSTVDSIRLPMLLDFPIIVYPYDLQKEMVSFLDKKVAEIDAIIIKKQNIIQKLDAYKKSLIFEYVTGKRLV